ncbi:lytic murein transglycosylase B [Reichenbachiella agarivorans]|uniref:Lytic murein transglycosylase B n=1 Tax=Reichenbachiella agarivorans TaxID=2979464 RepID=A0ABY6CN94_9BACT|nr:lytic murein transglycosylase B [Reichenbachiella agarivorans]UXP31229.1 lytic murein transglycosylase B [Reichenbachiella agarivorans]
MQFIPRIFTILAFLLVSISSLAQINQTDVDDFVRIYASQNHLALEDIEAIVSKATFQPSIIDKMTKPAEQTMTWTRYRGLFLTDARIDEGIKFWAANETTLRQVSKQTGVSEEVILGIIGVETFFGTRAGSYSVLDALYTLAFGYPKRSAFFKAELGKFLELCTRENLDPLSIKGSYAGAMGYCQFMPSSYLAYAKNFDQQGSTDLMNNVDDAIASVANYIQVHRWQPGKPVVTKAIVTDSAKLPLAKQSVKPSESIKTYQNMGFQTADGSSTNEQVTLQEFVLDEGSEYWFGFNNFYVITRYNHSPLYALAVYQLGEAIKTKKAN